MAAITHPRFDVVDDDGEVVDVPGARARATAVRSRTGRRPQAGAPTAFSGDGRLRSPAPPARLASVPLVARDDLAFLRPLVAPRRPLAQLVAVPVTGPGRTARPAAVSAPAHRRPSAATYRRRRLVVAALFLGALLTGSWVLGALGGGSLTASERGSSSTVELEVQPVSRSTYVVTPGDTLWSIARALQAEGDVRPVVDALATTRQGRPLEVGETIVLP